MERSTLRMPAILVGCILTPAFAQSPAPVTPPSKPTPPAVTAPAKPASPAAAETARESDNTSRVDINSASAEALGKLNGIGDVRAAAIIESRPYKGKDELARKSILPDGVYAGIKDRIVAKQK